MRPLCACGNQCKPNGKSKKDGRQLYQTICRSCDKKKYGDGRLVAINKRIKGKSCENCGFIAEHPCQLDLYHIDGNRLNYAPENTQTLCANCHRMKTFMNRDWDKRNTQKTPN